MDDDSLSCCGQIKIVHRDIAVRNILLGENNTVKLGDFGLARYILEGDSEWKMDRAARLPVRYMAPETFVKKRFSIMSDVWSFGIALWEMMTFVVMLSEVCCSLWQVR